MNKETLLLIISMAERAQRDAERVRMHVDLLHGRLDLIQSALTVVLDDGFSEEKRALLAILEEGMVGQQMKDLHRKEDHEIEQFDSLIAHFRALVENME